MTILFARTDGACSGNPGPAGWAYVITNASDEIVGENQGGNICETNIQMELEAVSQLLSDPRVYGSQLILYVDYIGIKHWLEGSWARNNERVKLQCSQIEELIETNGIELTIFHVKGHSTDKWNNYVDDKARIESQRLKNKQ